MRTAGEPAKIRASALHGARLRRSRRTLAAVVAIGAIAVTLAACAPPPPAPAPAPAAPSAAAQDIANAINSQRTAHGLGPVAIDGGLSGIADSWSAHLAATGTLAHQDLSTIGGWSALGETIEQGQCDQSAQTIVDLWMNSPPHQVILLSSAYRAVGISTACSGDGRGWVVADFGG